MCHFCKCAACFFLKCLLLSHKTLLLSTSAPNHIKISVLFEFDKDAHAELGLNTLGDKLAIVKLVQSLSFSPTSPMVLSVKNTLAKVNHYPFPLRRPNHNSISFEWTDVFTRTSRDFLRSTLFLICTTAAVSLLRAVSSTLSQFLSWTFRYNYYEEFQSICPSTCISFHPATWIGVHSGIQNMLAHCHCWMRV